MIEKGTKIIITKFITKLYLGTLCHAFKGSFVTIEPNYMDWKINLDIVLSTKQLKQVTYEPTPVALIDSSTQEEKNDYQKWKLIE